MNIFVGADHRGFGLKEQLVEGLAELGYSVTDCGAGEYVKEDDYVDYGKAVGSQVVEGKKSMGVVVCGSGMGICIAANRVSGVRCGLGFDVGQVIAGRQDDDINVLALAADYMSYEQAMEMVRAFLETDFSGEERHVRRLGKLDEGM